MRTHLAATPTHLGVRAHPAVGAALGGAVLLLASCSSGTACQRQPVPAGCPDLRIGTRAYDEWRPVVRPAILQELGDATYPACTHADECGGDRLSGLGATDVWRLDGVPPARAVLGLRQDTGTYVVFVRRDTDPQSLRSLIDPALLRGSPG
jgi:hypothetical protein